MKFYEILTHFPKLTESSQSGRPIRSLHLCEAPGAFISALVHYCSGKDPKAKTVRLGPSERVLINLYLAKNHLSPDWYATSLNPWHEEAQPGTVINIDSLILQFPGPSYDYHTHVSGIHEPFPVDPTDRRIPGPSYACIPAFSLLVALDSQIVNSHCRKITTRYN